VQLPKAAWHPAVVKQYSFVDPQKPLTEQHGREDGHVYPSAPPPVPFFPQVLSGEIARTEIFSRCPAEAMLRL
jgi:hypothetical protein